MQISRMQRKAPDIMCEMFSVPMPK
nr:unnamed protein product [Callosobruchus chinensis]